MPSVTTVSTSSRNGLSSQLSNSHGDDDGCSGMIYPSPDAEKTEVSTVTSAFSPRDFRKHYTDRNVMEAYTLGDRLGEGGHGNVYACVHKVTGARRAMKVITKQYRSYNSQLQLSQQDDGSDVNFRVNSMKTFTSAAHGNSDTISTDDGTELTAFSQETPSASIDGTVRP